MSGLLHLTELLDPFLHFHQSPTEIIQISFGWTSFPLTDRLAGSK